MRKFGIYLLFIAVAVVIASIFGVAHHQVTFSVSPEYYTKFKFIQTNLADTLAAQHMTQPRSAVVIAGVKTSWAIGLVIGAVLGLIALIFPSAETMFSSALQALGLALIISILIALGSYYYGPNAHIGTGAYDTLPAHLPGNLHNKGAFFRAASIQYGVLLGWCVGLFGGMILLLVKNGRVRRRINTLGSDPILDSPGSPETGS
ncbi:MAG TPA: hypothetical protein VNW04_20680 [Puia sp.]|nr:hypothetical protein [Puia sp.]